MVPIHIATPNFCPAQLYKTFFFVFCLCYVHSISIDEKHGWYHFLENDIFSIQTMFYSDDGYSEATWSEYGYSDFKIGCTQGSRK